MMQRCHIWHCNPFRGGKVFWGWLPCPTYGLQYVVLPGAAVVSPCCHCNWHLVYCQRNCCKSL